MKLQIKDFRQHKKLWSGLVLALILALTSWYYFWIYAPNRQKQQSSTEFEQMIKFEVKDDKIAQDIQDKYFIAFDAASKFFTEHQNSLEAYDALLKMGLIKQFIGDYRGAEQIFLYTYKLEPNSYILNGNIAHLYQYYLKDYPKAEEFYRKAVATAKGGNLYSYYTEMYDLYHDGFKDPAKTQALLTEATTAITDSFQLYQLAGQYYRSIGDPVKARDYFEKALKLNPNDEVSKRALENL